jgi:hypothetical protein
MPSFLTAQPKKRLARSTGGRFAPITGHAQRLAWQLRRARVLSPFAPPRDVGCDDVRAAL